MKKNEKKEPPFEKGGQGGFKNIRINKENNNA